MHLSGLDSNPPEPLETVLRSASEGSSACHSVARAAVSEGKRLGNGVVQRAVIRALADAVRVIDVGGAHMAVEALLARSASRDSVSRCLSTGARAGRFDFERVARGGYQLARSR
jgi:hypothetical protein